MDKYLGEQAPILLETTASSIPAAIITIGDRPDINKKGHK
jgi:hypothetical protein